MQPHIEKNLAAIIKICRKHHVHRLAVFGSSTDDRFDPGRSDIDFIVEFDPLSPREHANCYFGLSEDLEHLFSKNVDLVEPGSVRNPYFRRSMEETRIEIYAAS